MSSTVKTFVIDFSPQMTIQSDLPGEKRSHGSESLKRLKEMSDLLADGFEVLDATAVETYIVYLIRFKGRDWTPPRFNSIKDAK